MYRNIVLNEKGGPNHANNLCGAGIIVDSHTKEITYEPPYYAMGHFSRFLPPNGRTHRITHSVQFGSPAKQQYAYSNQPYVPPSIEYSPEKEGAKKLVWQTGEGVSLTCMLTFRAKWPTMSE
jgi:hypothetical protein